MCGRFVQAISLKALEKQYGISGDKAMEDTPNYNVSPGDYAYVISSDAPLSLKKYQFGLSPNWAKKPMYLFNARSEGDFNKSNDTAYSGDMGIVSKPSFKKPIRSQRCVVLVNAFIEGPEMEKLNHPFAISRKDGEMLSLAGIWDEWVNPDSGEVIRSFAIITTPANGITQVLGHPRCPAIIPKGLEKRWLNTDLSLHEVLSFLKPHPSNCLKAVPISVKIKDSKNKRQELILPIGEELTDQSDPIVVKTNLKLQGMGARKKKKDPPGWQRTLFD